MGEEEGLWGERRRPPRAVVIFFGAAGGIEIGEAKKASDSKAFGVSQTFFFGRALFEASSEKDMKRGAEVKGFFEIVGDHQEADVMGFEEREEVAPKLLSQGGIERREGFIEQEKARAGEEGACEGDSLSFAAAELVDGAIQERRQAKHRKEPLPKRFVGGLFFAKAQAESDIFFDA